MSKLNLEDYLFYCKTDEATYIKILAELLHNNLTDACFDFTKSGIKLIESDQKQPFTIFFDLFLYKDKLENYHCEKNFSIHINIQHFHKLLKSIKKKDIVELMIKNPKSGAPQTFDICVRQAESAFPTYSHIKIQKKQKLEIPVPTNYHDPVIIPSGPFQKLCKDMGGISSKTIVVKSQGRKITFFAEIDGIYGRDAPFGDLMETKGEEQVEHFNMKTFTQMIKISGLSGKIRVYTTKNFLKLSTEVGTLGTLDVHIKSKAAIDLERGQPANL